MELLDYMVILGLIFSGTTILFSIAGETLRGEAGLGQALVLHSPKFQGPEKDLQWL